MGRPTKALPCKYTGETNLYFGLGIGCSAGYYGYTGGLPGYKTANYYMPSTGTMILAWVSLQADVPKPGVANAIFCNIARLLTPQHCAVQHDRAEHGRQIRALISGSLPERAMPPQPPACRVDA
jgi:hypothetical protein